jgi:uracil-DNA glycosylase family 4
MTAHSSLTSLSRAITRCRACPRLVAHREQVARERKRAYRDWDYWGRPVPGFGDTDARLLVVGLAPGAHGANRTGRVFTGDSSGDWLYEALHRYGFASQPDSTGRDDGLRLRDCYITAAGRCAPPGNRPTQGELDACQPFLETELHLLARVRVVLTLGHVAHRQWLRASGWSQRLPPKARPAFAHGAVTHLEGGQVVISSYHPSRQNTNTGRLTREMWYAVFERAREILDRGASGG